MSRSMLLLALLFIFSISPPLAAQDKTVTVTITADKAEAKHVPVCVPLSLPRELGKMSFANLTGHGLNLPGQLTAPSITTESIPPTGGSLVRRDLHFVVPALKKGNSLTLTAKLAELDSAPDITSFFWMTPKDEPPVLYFDVLSGVERRPVLRYMNAAFDDSTKEARDRTYKVFHHLYDPTGKQIVTNGGHADLKQGESRKLLYPHHRGIMFGFNKCTYGEGLAKKADTWHCTGDTHVAHEKVLTAEAGQVLGRHRVLIGWHGEKKERFAEEERELTVYHVPGGTLVEFASRLKAVGGPVRLDGDPQHAGFQFRASNDVAEKTAKQTYYVRTDGKDEPGKTRNWPGDKSHVDLPWYAMSFMLADQRYTACYLNHPHNPKETRFSERDYGRFGGYFAANVTEKQPLVVNYRLWLQNGEMTGDQAQAWYTAFATPLKSVVK